MKLEIKFYGSEHLHLKKWVTVFLCLFFSFAHAQPQSAFIKGNLTDKTDHSPLIGVGILLVSKSDSTRKPGTASDTEGNFFFRGLTPGIYVLRTAYLGYKPLEMEITVAPRLNDLGTIQLEQSSVELKDVNVVGKQTRAEQKGDTTEYNANAYKTNPDATTQDLVAKMPGITISNGAVTAQGEAVQKVLIDGKEFFGDDAAMALRNLPAEIVDKIQVFDRPSDQAQFTGFYDGNPQKAINIVTKSGKSNGKFGKIFGGYGSDNRYNAGGNLNLFNGNRRISIIGLSNNINQQNFSTQDILGVVGTSGQQGRPGGGGQGGGQGGANNFLVGQQGGINTTQSLGINYADKWGQKTSITASYFFNKTDNETNGIKERDYFLKGGASQLYNETNNALSNNINHRFNIRLEYKMDSSNSILLTPRLNLQYNQSNNYLTGVNTLSDHSTLSKINTINTGNNSGYDFANNILYRHKFNKVKRTFSVDFGIAANDKKGTAGLYSKNEYFFPSDSTALTDQRNNTSSGGYKFSASFNYTEPIGKTGMLQFNYSPTYNKNNSDKETNARDTVSDEYSILNKILSNKFDNTIITQRGGVSYRIANQKFNFMVSVNYQNVALSGSQLFPQSFETNKYFNNAMPMAMLNYKFSAGKNLRITYRTATNAPSVTQLQNVVNNANPLQLSSGNQNLTQEYAHTVIARYGTTNKEKATVMQFFLMAAYTANYIGSSTLIAARDTVIQNGVTLKRGSQLVRPVNLDGYWNANSFLTYGFPVNVLKSNLNLNAGISYSRTPGLINEIDNDANTYNINSGFTLASNISEKVDFNLSYSGNYNIVKNTIRQQSNSNYFYHTASLRFNMMPWKGLVLTSDLTNTLYAGLGGAYDLNFFLWNPGIGYKFLKNNAAEIRLSAFDLLNQNNSVSRNVTGTYIENTRTQVLNRYFMLTFTYSLRNFKGASKN